MHKLKTEPRLNSLVVYHFDAKHQVKFEFFTSGTYSTTYLDEGDFAIDSYYQGRKWKLAPRRKIALWAEPNSEKYRPFWETPEWDHQLYLALKEWLEVDSILLNPNSETK